ncbi:MAG: hypothetical protein RR543_04815 [Erysipelotrichales bacterium]
MKFKDVAVFGLGVVAGILLAPKKGSDTYEELKQKTNNLYLEAKDINIDSIKDKIEDIKIEVTKLDFDRSKEIVSEQSVNLKTKLNQLITDLQENKKVQPALESAIDATQGAIINVIDFIDEKELIDKTVDGAKTAYGKSIEYIDVAKEKANDIADVTAKKAGQVADATAKKAGEIADVTAKKASELVDSTKNKANEFVDATQSFDNEEEE